MNKKSSNKFNNFFMKEALKQANLALAKNEVPVGVVIVDRKSKKIIVKTHNLVEKKHNPIFHAEIVAISESCKILSNKILSDYDMYVTLEPCIMCVAAISFARIGKLFYSTSNLKQGGIEKGGHFFYNKTCLFYPEIYSGFLEKQSKNLIKKFFENIRSKNKSL